MNGLPEKFLFRSAIQNRVVSNDVLTEEKPTQIFVFPENRILFTYVYVLDADGKPLLRWGGVAGRSNLESITPKVADVIASYRAYRLFEEAKRINQDIVLSCLVAPFLHLLQPEGEEAVSLKKILLGLCDEPTLNAILQEVPATLAAKLRRVRDEFGIPLETDSVTDVIDAGLVDYDADMKELRVEHPRDRKERIARWKTLLESVRPHLQAFLRSQGHLENCDLLGDFERCAIMAFDRKLTNDTSLLVGVTILAQIAFSTEAGLRSIRLPEGVSVFYQHERNASRLRLVSEFIVREFDGETGPQTVASQLKSLMIQWDKKAKSDETKS